MNILLWIGVALCFGGGLLMTFARDWVWSVDKNAAGHPRDDNDNAIRTEKWDRNHARLGWLLLGVALLLAAYLFFL